MESFKVAYRLPHAGEATFVIPSLLPTDEPAELGFPEEEARAFRSRFDGLLLPQLIVARHADIDGEKVWRHGVLLYTKAQGGARALLRGDAYDRTLTIWISGRGLEHYFSVLYDEVRKVLQTMPELPREELIRLPAAARLAGQEFDPRETEPSAMDGKSAHHFIADSKQQSDSQLSKPSLRSPCAWISATLLYQSPVPGEMTA
jgi:hypothetical protein